MNPVEIRDLTLDDRLAHRRLMAQAFGKGGVVAPPAPDDPAPDALTGRYGLFENGELKAALTNLPFLVHWGAETTLAMGGIAGVATYAEARGRGHVDQLLRHSLERMRDAGQALSALYPFSWDFYRRYGWDWVGEKRHVKLPLKELKAAPEGRDVEVLTAQAAEVEAQLAPAYTAFARRYRGMNTAETHRWNRVLEHSDNRTTYPYVHTPTGAYLLWRFGGDGGDIREFVASTPDAYRGLLSLLHYFGAQTGQASVNLPPDTPLQSFLMHWNLKVETRPIFMARVVDVGAAMQAIDAPGVPNGAVTVTIQDEHAPWNQGVWRFTVEGGKTLAVRETGEPSNADVTLDIQAFSQAFWGKPGLDELRTAGRIDSVQSESGYRLLSQLLPAANVFTLDDF